MNGQEFFDYVNSGVNPVVRFNELVDDQENGFESGMMARVIGTIDDGGGVYKIFCDLRDFEDYNCPFEKPNWYDKENVARLKWSQTSFYPKDKVETIYWEYEVENVPFEIVEENSLFQEYKQSDSKDSYVVWLEKMVLSLRKTE